MLDSCLCTEDCPYSSIYIWRVTNPNVLRVWAIIKFVKYSCWKKATIHILSIISMLKEKNTSLCDLWLRMQALSQWCICYFASVNFSHMAKLARCSHTWIFIIFFLKGCRILSFMWILQIEKCWQRLIKPLYHRSNKICSVFKSSDPE